MDRLSSAGLGLDYGVVELQVVTSDWTAAGAALRDDIATLLAELAVAVEQIGSASVVGLRAKPIVDLAVGVDRNGDLAAITERLVAHDWTYRGDAGDNGGHVFVLDSRPTHRVAHIHVVDHGGSQWVAYLRLRDRLRADSVARSRYEQVKVALANQHPHDRAAYTEGKTAIVNALLAAGE